MTTNNWWKTSTVYQIYPQSFKDSNGDGIGDLNGITESLPYLKKLGIDVIWLNPIYESPLVDNGYDISDYYKLDSQYGTMADFENLLTQTHALGIRLVMDLVVNHTSNKNKWFEESKKSQDNDYADWYIWKDPKPDGSVPNNWGSSFGGSAWTYVPERKQYYLHLYAPEQPDLNWENEEVRDAIYKMMKFWFEKGVDGFRMDTISLLSKVQSFPDAPLEPGRKYGSAYFGAANGPRIHEFLQEMNREVLSKYDVMTVGETPHTTSDQAKLYTDPERHELNMVFQFEAMHSDYGYYGRYSDLRFKLSDMRRIMNHWQLAMDGHGWNSLFWGNHDQPRAVSRFGDDGEFRVQSAKMLATVLHFQQGTPFVFQGEEIGMTNAHFTKINEYEDVEALNIYRDLKALGLDEKLIMSMLANKSRDNSRTPMQWDKTENAGFTTGTPWYQVNSNYQQVNVKQALIDPNSIFYYYKNLIKLRHDLPIISQGRFIPLSEDDSDVYAYIRQLDHQQLLVVGSFNRHKIRFAVNESFAVDQAKLLIDTYGDKPEYRKNILYLRPYEGAVLKLG
ncbi:glycoside hydrolase family 13 protein [Oenococcus kitaharae]|uniref:Oligo-1,6-glucosidase n=1 Tax=Oenococcus kitaharae DSM 17330 TaxID=1045004 RepID=G9WHN6_9LACO|nr:alpha-glucosidase [Oenococcus kitaharae]EHN58610.1 oligo-1,6-glucosidase [Oenococcus kitaharae DSM 17330]OEY84691.1 oligo-1,6-glucosidase [Oenococcus kitaharae]OEY84975.1 oligo-1,6-glucosidase [Oenococcus kitaharae]OEY85765.1 oligo-1,6-glucosidase [Oenococcus kitaharae]